MMGRDFDINMTESTHLYSRTMREWIVLFNFAHHTYYVDINFYRQIIRK